MSFPAKNLKVLGNNFCSHHQGNNFCSPQPFLLNSRCLTRIKEFKMPKKAKSVKKLEKIATLQSDTDDDDEDFKNLRKKKGRKIVISDSSDDDEVTLFTSPKASTSKGKIHFICSLDRCTRYSQKV